MTNKNIETLNKFSTKSIPDLDIAVLGALELFKDKKIPKIDISKYKKPLVVGSGNAEATGRIIFEKTGAIFASESNYISKLKNISGIDGVFIISASGGKHAPNIVKNTKEMGLPVVLITNTKDSLASSELKKESDDIEYIFPKNREPYTYNTSTYMGMIIGKTGESSEDIKSFIETQVDNIDFSILANYDKYYLIVPSEFSGIIRMLQVKFIELFGRNVARDIETSEYVQHATTVATSNELFISFGYENKTWGESKNRLQIPLPKNADYAAMMAIGYYMVAQIQKSQPQYFKENIVEYCVEISDIFRQKINPIVE